MERYIGKTLDNRYEILEVIGKGGMAVVFKAKCHRLNRLVAIKMLKKDLSEDAEFRRRFHDESQAVAMLSHPNIMAVHDVSRGGDMDYIVMELIDGITLKQYMARRGKLDWRETLHFITQIMRGLSHAHSRNLIHRDIKPQNIMVLRDGTVKVTDFGIACLSNGANPSNEAIGSVHYISPEQAKGDYTDNRSDIYSAGVVLYEMLTGRLPFEGDNPVSVAIQHFSAVPLQPREIDPDIPEALEQICMKAMATDRKKRYTTADEMIADLEAFRKDPSLSFDYSLEELRDRNGEEEPTQYIPNVAATKTKQTRIAEPVHEDEDEYEERSRWGWLKVLLLLAVCLGIGYFAVTHLYEGVMNSFTPAAPTEFTVPNVIGMTLEEAREYPEVVGVFDIVDAYYQYNSEYPAGTIIDQSPKEGHTKKSGNGDLILIEVTVSRGVTSGEMPDLVRKERRAAELILKQNSDLTRLKLNVEVIEDEDFHEEIPVGCILRTDPVAGVTLKEGDTVTLYLSKGPEIIYRTMIPCVGQNMEWVQLQMESMNLVPVFKPVEDSAEVGTVLSQSVETNTEIAEGSTVTFTYSDGEKLLEQTVTVDIPYSFYPVMVQVYLDNTVIFESELAGDYGMLNVPVFAKAGSYELKVYIDYALVAQREIIFQ